MVAILQILNIKHSFNLTLDMKRSPQIMPKSNFMMLTPSMTSQGGLNIGPQYFFINEIAKFFMILENEQRCHH